MNRYQLIKVANIYSFLDQFNMDEWTFPDFLADKSKKAIEDLLKNALIPINKELDKYDEELTEKEQDLTTALRQVKSLMKTYRAQDEMDERYVL